MNRNPETVIVDYLRELLQEGATEAAPEEADRVPQLGLADQQIKLELLKRQHLQALLDGPLQTSPPEPAPTATDQAIAQQLTVEEAVIADPSSVPAELMAWCDNGRPAWAQNTFEILSFEVGGLTLAVPLIALGQIVRLSDALTPIFGQAKWFMGIQPTHFGSLRVLDTSLFVMPERYSPAMRQAARFVISIDGSPWGMAVDRIGQPRKIDPAAVTWRSHRSKRLWLAGTLPEQMCALIDVPQMARLLEMAERVKRR